MSQLATAPLRTAKHLKKIRDIKKVESAIRWHERARKKRQAIAAERWESKQTALASIKWTKDNVTLVRKRAIRNAREDWKLGPLRPNRAVGHEASKYGALQQEQMRRPPIEVRVQKNKNEVRERKGQEPEYPLVVDDKKFFHVVQDDRVVILKGREKGKIGTVANVIEQSHEVVVKNINMHYTDSSVWNIPQGENPAPKRETEATIPLSDVRLVVPYLITTENAAGERKDIFQDVIVDKVVMERHTTGIDPFTGMDYGHEEFPAEHRFDPETNLPVFKRYIAGTRSVIQWPWEKNDEVEHAKNTEKTSEEKTSWRNTILHPIKSYKQSSAQRAAAKEKKQQEEEEKVTQDETEIEDLRSDIEKTQLGNTQTSTRSEPKKYPLDSEADTGRNLAEPSDENRSFYPTLVYPPFPNELGAELGTYIRKKQYADAKDNINSKAKPSQQLTKQERRQKKAAAKAYKPHQLDTMKTPLQLRWEVERAQQEKAKPKVNQSALLLALGQHMQAQGIQMTPKRAKAAGLDVDID